MASVHFPDIASLQNVYIIPVHAILIVRLNFISETLVDLIYPLMFIQLNVYTLPFLSSGYYIPLIVSIKCVSFISIFLFDFRCIYVREGSNNKLFWFFVFLCLFLVLFFNNDIFMHYLSCQQADESCLSPYILGIKTIKSSKLCS